MPFVIDKRHRCFRELLQFFTHYIGRAALRNPKLLTNDVLAIAGASRTAVQLNDVGSVLSFLQTGRTPPKSLSFDIVIASDNRPRHAIRVLPGARLGPTLCVYLLGYAWERYAKRIEAKQPKEPAKPKTAPCSACGKTSGGGKQHADLPRWDADLQFFRHVRNACFHAGTFHIHDGQIKQANLPRWQGLVIPNRDINGTRVINGGLLEVPHVPWLLHDMGGAIDRVLGRRS